MQISITEDRYSLLQGVIPSTDTGFGSCLNIDDNGVHIFYVWKIIVFITKKSVLANICKYMVIANKRICIFVPKKAVEDEK